MPHPPLTQRIRAAQPRGALHAQFAGQGSGKRQSCSTGSPVTGDPEKFEEVFAKSSQFMRARPGFMNG